MNYSVVSSKKKIVIFCDVLPYPPNSGISIPLFHFINAMACHEVTVVCFSNDDDLLINVSREFLTKNNINFIHYASEDVSRIKKIMRMLFCTYPQYVIRIEDVVLNQINKLLLEIMPDIVYVDMPSLTKILELSNQIGLYTIYAPNDSLSLAFYNEIKHKSGLAKIKSIIDYRNAINLEKNNISISSKVIFVSELDKDFLCRRIGFELNNIEIIPNGVDIDLFKPNQKNNEILFVGKLDGGNSKYLKNFITNVYQKTNSEKRWKLNVVGSCNDEHYIEWLNSIDGISYLGFVNDISELYAKAFCVISPIRKNSGIINKVLEGLSSGALVVGYRESFAAIEGLSDFESCCICVDNDSEFIFALDSIFNTPRAYLSYQDIARTFAINNLSWDRRYHLFRSLVDSV